MAKAKGRRTGSRNRGYFYRDGRGWFTKVDGKFLALEFENGDRMRDRNTPVAELKAALRRVTDTAAIASTETPQAATVEAPASGQGVTVAEVCTAYLARVKDAGARATLIGRRNTLFDFCFGLPSRFIDVDKTKPAPKPKRCDYIHAGYRKGRIKSR